VKGPEYAADVIATSLGLRLGAFCTAHATAAPKTVRRQARAHEETVDAYPFVAVIARDVVSMRQLGPWDEEQAGTPYMVRYAVRVQCVTRSQGWDETDRARKRLILAAREALLSHRQLAPDARLVDQRWSERYYDLAEPSNNPVGRTLAGGDVTIEVDVEEFVTEAPLHDVDTIDVVVVDLDDPTVLAP
jgi:hypothetical protein